MTKSFKIFLGVLGGLILISAMNDSTKPPKSEAQRQVDSIQVAGFACERLAKTTLRDPDSWQAIRIDPTGSTVGVSAPYDYQAVITGRAKNGFGGYNNLTIKCQFQYNSTNVKVTQIQ